jgi:hypothetical protein
MGGAAIGALSSLQSLLDQSPVQTTYSFKDLVGVLTNDLLAADVEIVGGNIGNGNLTVRMATERTTHHTANDGTVMPTYKAGRSGEVTIEMQQTSALHHTLIALFNALETQANAGDISNWAGTRLTLRTILDGSGHICSGVSFQKIADKPYASDGQNVTWVLMCADIVNQ